MSNNLEHLAREKLKNNLDSQFEKGIITQDEFESKTKELEEMIRTTPDRVETEGKEAFENGMRSMGEKLESAQETDLLDSFKTKALDLKDSFMGKLRSLGIVATTVGTMTSAMAQKNEIPYQGPIKEKSSVVFERDKNLLVDVAAPSEVDRKDLVEAFKDNRVKLQELEGMLSKGVFPVLYHGLFLEKESLNRKIKTTKDYLKELEARSQKQDFIESNPYDQELVDDQRLGVVSEWKEEGVPLSGEDQAILRAYGEYDNQRLKELIHLDNPEYQRRVRENLEASGLFGTGTYVLEKQKANLADDYLVVEGLQADSLRNAIGFTEKEANQVSLPTDNSLEKGVAAHEFRHEATDLERLIPSSVKELYRQSARPFSDSLVVDILEKRGGEKIKNILDTISKEKKEIFLAEAYVYFTNPTEIDARKRQLENDLESAGVWKYGELFTEKTLDDIKKLGAQGALSGGSIEFLMLIKPENLPGIMNTVE